MPILEGNSRNKPDSTFNINNKNNSVFEDKYSINTYKSNNLAENNREYNPYKQKFYNTGLCRTERYSRRSALNKLHEEEETETPMTDKLIHELHRLETSFNLTGVLQDKAEFSLLSGRSCNNAYHIVFK